MTEVYFRYMPPLNQAKAGLLFLTSQYCNNSVVDSVVV